MFGEHLTYRCSVPSSPARPAQLPWRRLQELMLAFLGFGFLLFWLYPTFTTVTDYIFLVVHSSAGNSRYLGHQAPWSRGATSPSVHWRNAAAERLHGQRLPAPHLRTFPHTILGARCCAGLSNSGETLPIHLDSRQ